MHRVCHKRQQACRQAEGGTEAGVVSRPAAIPSKVKPTNCQQLPTTPSFPALTLAAYYRPVELVETAA